MSLDARELVTALNLYVLETLCQIARDDMSDACLRFGINEEVARKIANLNTAQIFEISRSPRFFFYLDEGLVKAAIKDIDSGNGYGQMHNTIADIADLLKKGGE